MRLFLSAGEPSGDLHAANLISALGRLDPALELTGFGGPRMAEAGCPLVEAITHRAIMGYRAVAEQLPYFLRLLSLGRNTIRKFRPDAVVVLDYPGFHFALSKRVAAMGVPVIWFVAPQLWAWANWRVAKMRRWVDTVLVTLPFEEEWFRGRGVNARWVGHPYFDELRERTLDADFLAGQRSRGGRVVTVLPGSRRREVERNLPQQLATARLIHSARPDTRFLVASYNDVQAQMARETLGNFPGLPAEVVRGRTAEAIEAASVCVSVSGSVSLELMYHLKPSTIQYCLPWTDSHILKAILTTPHVTLVNLLANERLFPEYVGHRDESAAVAGEVLRWLDDPAEHARVVGRLSEIRERVAAPGACAAAAAAIAGRVRELRTARKVG